MGGKRKQCLCFHHLIWITSIHALSSSRTPTKNALCTFRKPQKFQSEIQSSSPLSYRHKRPLHSLSLGRNYPESDSWLEHKTETVLDFTCIPRGQLTTDDIDTITGLMAAWARKKSDSAALVVEALLKRVVDDWNAGNLLAKVTTRMYTMAIDSWAKASCGLQAAYRANDIHNNMKRLYEDTRDESIRPTTISYNAVINSWSKCADPVSPYKAEEILKQMIHGWKVMGDIAVRPDVVSFTSCIDAWAKSGEAEAPTKALGLFHLMERFYELENEHTMKPNVYTYSACINAFAKSSDMDSPHHAESLLNRMKESVQAGDISLRPNVINYNSCINAWGRNRLPHAAEKAEGILRVMQNDGVKPDALSYSLVVSAWCHSSAPGGIQRADSILKELEISMIRGVDKNIPESSIPIAKETGISVLGPTIIVSGDQLDVECYNSVLIALSKSRDDDVVDRSLALLNRMKKMASLGFFHVKPNTKSWNAVLNTISRSSRPDAALVAEEVFTRMQKFTKPDVFSFAALLHAYQKSSSDRGAAHRADSIVRTMEEMYLNGEIASPPDVYHYTIVCSCWARSGEKIAAYRCGQILRHMEQKYNAGQINCKPNVRTFNAVIDAYARGKNVEEAEALLDLMISRFKNGDTNLKPDCFTFNACINAYTRSRKKGCGDRAEMILRKLLDFHAANPDVQPDTRSFSHLIDFYSRSTDEKAAERAEIILLKMIELYRSGCESALPNIFCFTGCIGSYSINNYPDAGKRAERICRLSSDLYSETKISKLKPNTFLMNTVIHAWLKSGDPSAGEVTEVVLREMERKFAEGMFEMQTNTRTYGLVLAAWAKSQNADKATRAKAILKLMTENSKRNKNICVNIHCYNSVINAAAFTEGEIDDRMRAFQVATSTLNELIQSDVEPISASFGTYLKACGKLALSTSFVEPYIEKAFVHCQNLGLVNEFVLMQVKCSSTHETYRKLFKSVFQRYPSKETIRLDDVPESWKSNIDDGSRNISESEWWRQPD